MTELYVDLQDDSYSISIEQGNLKRLDQCLEGIFQQGKIFLVTDANVAAYYLEQVKKQLSEIGDVFTMILPPGESSKSGEMLFKLYAKMAKAGLSRSDLVIALGGGVVGDLTGYAAATFLRGMPYVQIPTSLLAQVDSSVGGKTAIDLPAGKNLVGAFKQPTRVWIDPLVLETLPKKYLIDGMGEVIKYGCIQRPQLFASLEKWGSLEQIADHYEQIIYECVDCKRKIVEIDPFDHKERMLLNFGHTLGHTIEQYYHYKKVSHGEGVAIGMAQITAIAEEKGLTKPDSFRRICELLGNYQLPYKANLLLKDIMPALVLDKKNLHHKLHLILLKKIGDAYIYPTDETFFDLYRQL